MNFLLVSGRGLLIAAFGIFAGAGCWLVAVALKAVLSGPPATVHFFSMLALTLLVAGALAGVAALIRPHVRKVVRQQLVERARSGELIAGATVTVVAWATGLAWAAELFMGAWVSWSLVAMWARLRAEMAVGPGLFQVPPHRTPARWGEPSARTYPDDLACPGRLGSSVDETAANPSADKPARRFGNAGGSPIFKSPMALPSPVMAGAVAGALVALALVASFRTSAKNKPDFETPSP